MKNLRFNRIEKGGRHKYLDDFEGIRKFGSFEYVGLIKCKLVHNQTYSVVLPDQIYLRIGENYRWIQPLYFSGNQISKLGDYGFCELVVDISHGACLKMMFKTNDIIGRLNDGSFLYRCTFKGPNHLSRYTTGPATIIKNKLYLKLYHHTTKQSKISILKSNEFLSSSWNIQGTKRSENISYLYLTQLPKISCSADLYQIAMSSHGKIPFRVDSNFTDVPDLVLDVYRESTNNRTYTLSYWVDSSLLATQPCYHHMPPDGFGYHEVVSPFIHRLGVEYDTKIMIYDDQLLPESPKTFDYTVVGNATKIEGLAAPFDEENTQEVLKVERIKDPDDIISFWIKNGNSNQYDNKDVEKVSFT